MKMIADTPRIRRMQEYVDSEPDPVARLAAQRKLDRIIALLEDFPRRVAAQGPFVTAAEARAVLEREVAVVIAAIDE
jgi:hypothetical protein